MIYILIFVMTQYQNPGAAQGIEFNSLEACRAAAAEIRKQERDNLRASVLLCAAKGKP